MLTPRHLYQAAALQTLLTAGKPGLSHVERCTWAAHRAESYADALLALDAAREPPLTPAEREKLQRAGRERYGVTDRPSDVVVLDRTSIRLLREKLHGATTSAPGAARGAAFADVIDTLTRWLE